MKNVLIVDDEKNLRESLQDGFPDHAEDFKILTAENGAKATVILSSMQIDLVITDLKMPVMDGFELLAFMSKYHPNIPAIIMTAHASVPDIAHKLKEYSTTRYLQKPFDLDELGAMIDLELSIGSSDRLQGLTLPDFLQLITTEKRTMTLSVEYGDEAGKLYFSSGELLDAETGSLFGNDAVYHMADWEHAKIDISPRCGKTAKKVSASIQELLREGQRRKEQQPAEPDNRADAPPHKANIDEQSAAAIVDAFLKESVAQEPVTETRKPGTTVKEEKMATTKEILGDLAKVQSIEAVCLVARDGFLLESIGRSGIDKEMIGAIASSGFGASDSMGRQLDKGTMQICMIEFEKGPVLLSPVGEDAFLVIVADKEANLGMIRLKLKKHSGELAVATAAAI